MDYEKKYKEALERAKNYHDNNFSFGTTKLTEAIFPELRESEDERIRKYLIEELKAAKSVGELKFIIPQPTREECIVYLEKQKERGPLTKEEEYTLQRIIEYLEDETCPPEWISLLHDIYCLPYEKQKEQKPAVSREEILHQLLQNDSITLSDYLYLTEKQKPAWSEEDEKMRYFVTEAVQSRYSDRELSKYIDPGIIKEKKQLKQSLFDWLRDLRPSWKPSEDQMDALKELIDDANRSGWVTPGATELYEQLKKL